MVIARQAFLNSDFYQPISDSLNEIVSSIILKLKETQAEEIPYQVLDIGCGEGYYSQRLHNSLSDSGIDHNVYGLDISKEAILAAAKRAKAVQDKDSEWLVASAIDIPLQEKSIDIATCLFTRLMPESYHKVIKQDGYFICVNTGEKHLIELREKLYDQITKVEFDPIKNMGDDFELIEQQQVNYQNTLSSQQQIQDLLLMTPHNWRTKAENKETLSALEELTVTIDAQIHVFKAKAKAEVVEAVIETIVTEKTIEEVATTTTVEAEAISPKTKSTSVNPWAKAAEKPAAPVADKLVQEESTLKDDTPEEASVEIEAPVEIKDNKETSSAKVNPWAKS